MKNVLVTGGAGFIGSNFVRFLLEKNQHVRIINLDALTYAGSLLNLAGVLDSARHIFVEANICDKDVIPNVLKKYDVDTIVHFAAETHVDRSILEPDPFFQTNVLGTLNLLESAKEFWAQKKMQGRFHHISTDEVYGSLAENELAFTESSTYFPRSPYSASKAASDHLVRAYFHTYNIHVTLTNCSNNYGAYQFVEKLIPFTILNALQGNSLPIYGDGKQIRDWLYVQDHCEAIYNVLERGSVGETYNIAGNNQICNLDLIQMICAMLDEFQPAQSSYASLITHVSDRFGHDRRYALDTTKIYNQLGWSPKYNIEAGLRETVQWYLQNPDWMQAAFSKMQSENWLEKNYQHRG